MAQPFPVRPTEHSLLVSGRGVLLATGHEPKEVETSKIINKVVILLDMVLPIGVCVCFYLRAKRSKSAI